MMESLESCCKLASSLDAYQVSDATGNASLSCNFSGMLHAKNKQISTCVASIKTIEFLLR